MKFFVVTDKESPSLLYKKVGCSGYFPIGIWFGRYEQAQMFINSRFFPELYKIYEVESNILNKKEVKNETIIN